MSQLGNQSDLELRPWRRLVLAVQVILALGLLATAFVPLSAPTSASASPPADDVGALFEEGQEEGEEAECAFEEELFEDEDEGFCEEGEGESGAADECPLRSAHGHSATTHGRLKITIGYTSFEPVLARVQIHAGGVETFKRHLGRSGVLRFTQPLTRNDGGRVLVRIDQIGRAGCPSRKLALHLLG